MKTLQAQLLAMESDQEKKENGFYKDLTFGTSGIRGKMGAGTAHINPPVIARATKGVAAYLHKLSPSPRVGIAYDSRENSGLFRDITAAVLLEEGIEVYVFPEISPVASLSFAIRQLGLDMGIMLTASHNPREYNGYKVYDQTGGQIVDREAHLIWEEIRELDYFHSLPTLFEGAAQDMYFEGTAESAAKEKAKSFEKLRQETLEENPGFHYMPPQILEEYVEAAVQAGLPGSGMEDLRIVYSPLCGAGRRFVREALQKGGLGYFKEVESQGPPDGTFKSCPFPNPERIEVFAEAEACCGSWPADLLMVTDPDCDRIGVAVVRPEGFWYPTGNQMGILLTNYLCENLEVQDRVIVRSIVASPLVDKIAAAHGARVETTLTGFKYIGKKMDVLKEKFLIGFEEGTGYLAATHVRDKDAVSSALLIAQMAAFYKSRGMDLFDALFEIYEEYGYLREEAAGYVFEGSRGETLRSRIMEELRQHPESYFPSKEYKMVDYRQGIRDLPSANVLEFQGRKKKVKTILRPSGTEPKIKAYVFAHGKNKDEVRQLLDQEEGAVDRLMKELQQ